MTRYVATLIHRRDGENKNILHVERRNDVSKLHRGFDPLRTHEALAAEEKSCACERLGELVGCVCSCVYIFHADGLLIDLFHEKMNTYQEMANSFVIAGETRSQFDERLVIDQQRAGRSDWESEFCQDVAEIDDILGGFHCGVCF